MVTELTGILIGEQAKNHLTRNGYVNVTEADFQEKKMTVGKFRVLPRSSIYVIEYDRLKPEQFRNNSSQAVPSVAFIDRIANLISSPFVNNWRVDISAPKYYSIDIGGNVSFVRSSSGGKSVIVHEASLFIPKNGDYSLFNV